MSKKAKKKQQLQKIETQQNGILLPGRHDCDCQGMIHGLVNNCLICGKIVCEQQGEGPCFFCGNVVLNKNRALEDFPEMMQQQTNFIDDLSSIDNKMEFIENQDKKQKIKQQTFQDDFEKIKAIEHKNKLIQRDKQNNFENNIYDEQTDWYQIAEDIWQSRENRDLAIKNLIIEKDQFEEDQSKIQLRFEGWEQGFSEVVAKMDHERSQKDAQEFLKKINKQEGEQKKAFFKEDDENKENKIKQDSQNKYNLDTRIYQSNNSQVVNVYEDIRQEINQKYQEYLKSRKTTSQQKKNILEKFQIDQENGILMPKIQDFTNRVQHDSDIFQEDFENFLRKQKKEEQIEDVRDTYDEELFDIKLYDHGQCLSMLQPWASLLIEGFKRFEGRMWTSSYRGPLWIHAGATQPTPETIKQVEAQYAKLYEGKNRPNFPSRYPTGSLIGIIDLQGILTKEEYVQLVPEQYREENDSDYLFVVRNPRKLIYPIKMFGNKNIFKIDEDVRKTAQKCLQRVPTGWLEYVAKDVTITEKLMQNIQNQIVNQKEEKLDKNQKNKQEQEEQFNEQIEQKQQNNELKSHQEWTEQIKKIASKFTLKHDIYGYQISNLLKISEINDLIYIAENNQEKEGLKALGPKNPIELKLDQTFPCLEKILKSIPPNCGDLMKKIKRAEGFYINQKQKQFEIDDDVLILMSFGCQLEMQVEIVDEMKVKNYTFDGNCIIYPDKKKNLRKKFSGIKSDGIRDQLDMRNEYKIFFIYFKR